MIFGKFGCPALGLEGAAWATLISRTAILIAIFIWLHLAPGLRDWIPHRWLRKPDPTDLKRLLHIGLPASLQMLCEVAAFSSAGLLMGHFGPTALAAHQLAITCAATSFMIPLGLSMALTVRIGEAHGAGEIHRLRPILISGWILSAGFALAAASFVLLLGKPLAALFIDAPHVITLTATLPETTVEIPTPSPQTTRFNRISTRP
jgi:MATE family multidrug resistance protein